MTHKEHIGLTQGEAKRRLLDYGPNILVEKKPPSKLFLLTKQVKSPLIYVLLIASIITFSMGDFVDTGVILFAVVINTILGFVQEYKAEQTLYALKKMLNPQARVIREGKTVVIRAAEVVPGDTVVLTHGDKVPADGTIIEAVNLFLNESILTGESNPVAKTSAEGNNAASMGTIVASGRGRMLVTKTGMQTEIGAIAESLGETSEEATPLQAQIASLARSLATIVLVSSMFIFLLGIFFGERIVSMFTTSVAIAVAAIPEGMVVSLTVILAIGMQRILHRKAIVRKLVAAETLGSVTVLCVDKTGTITQGVMEVVEQDIVDSEKAAKAATLANDLVDPIEIALWDWARGQNHTDPQQIVDTNPRTAELPFDGVRKYMAVATNGDLWIKGAPEVLLEKSLVSVEERKRWMSRIESYGQNGLRVIGLAHKQRGKTGSIEQDVAQLEFIGIVGISDPIRQGVGEALDICRSAGVRVKIVTGDYRVTSEAILRRLGIVLHDPKREIMEGRELEEITNKELEEKVGDVVLFSRVTPQQKLKIVSALQARGEVVAMTGDGVNDAMALKKAEIGIVVSDASDVARETADLVLLDSNLGTIAAAIEEGRGIFENIRKVVLYLLSDAFSEMLLIVSAIVLRAPLPLTAVQILWINIISDGPANLALTVEPKDRDLMLRQPRVKHTPIVDRQIKTLIFVISITTSILTLIAFLGALSLTGDLIYARTLAFAMIGVDSLLYVFSCRSLYKPILSERLDRNPWLVVAFVAGLGFQLLAVYHPWAQVVFETTPLAFYDWAIVFGAGGILISIIEGIKYAFLRRNTPVFGSTRPS